MENLAEIAEFLSSNPAIHWMSENPLETAGYAISAAGTFSFARAFQGGLNTYTEYKAALEDRNIDRYNELQEDYQGTLEELESFPKPLFNPYDSGSVFGHLKGKVDWVNSNYNLESSRFEINEKR